MVGQPGFFDFDDRLRRLSDLGDQLEAFAAAVDFELFRPVLDAALAYADGAKGGRPPLDPVLMFKVLIIQAANGLSDERAEYLINDRLSFMRFLGLSLGDRVPDARTIWLFRERLTRAGSRGGPPSRCCSPASMRRCGPLATSPCQARLWMLRWSPRRASATRLLRRPRSRPGAFQPSGRPSPRSFATRTATHAGP